jgi:hypothetical protein
MACQIGSLSRLPPWCTCTAPYEYTQQLLRIPQMLFRYVVALAATAFASGADAQALTPSQAAAYFACAGAPESVCASKQASCTSKLDPLVISNPTWFASFTAASVTCVTDAKNKFAPYIPSPGARRRLADADFCPTECQDATDCRYDAVIPCIKKIDGIPSGFVDAFTTEFACLAKALECVFALFVTVVPH